MYFQLSHVFHVWYACWALPELPESSSTTSVLEVWFQRSISYKQESSPFHLEPHYESICTEEGYFFKYFALSEYEPSSHKLLRNDYQGGPTRPSSIIRSFFTKYSSTAILCSSTGQHSISTKMMTKIPDSPKRFGGKSYYLYQVSFYERDIKARQKTSETNRRASRHTARTSSQCTAGSYKHL